MGCAFSSVHTLSTLVNRYPLFGIGCPTVNGLYLHDIEGIAAIVRIFMVFSRVITKGT